MAASLVQVGHHLPRVARQALEALILGTSLPHVKLGPAAPVFVTLRSPDGSLRGCVGSTRPAMPTVTEETMRSAQLAAGRDPRFAMLAPAELPEVSIEVSVLLPAQEVTCMSQLAPDHYGVIVQEPGGARQGVLLPGIEGVIDASIQVAIARRKAGLDDTAPVLLSRFEVMKFREC